MYLTAFIPLNEYLENGGILEHQHQFFYKDGAQYHAVGWYEAERQANIAPGLTVVTTVEHSMQFINDILYVMIPVTPIYTPVKTMHLP